MSSCKVNEFQTPEKNMLLIHYLTLLAERAMQFRYYNVAMTTDDGEFTLKALEVTNRREEDGLAHMRVSSDCLCFDQDEVIVGFPLDLSLRGRRERGRQRLLRGPETLA